MATKTIKTKFQMRNDTAANWASANPVLLIGEIGFENDTNKFKFGDGTTFLMREPTQRRFRR